MYITFLLFLVLATGLQIAATQMNQRHMTRNEAAQIMIVQVMTAFFAALAGYTLGAAG